MTPQRERGGGKSDRLPSIMGEEGGSNPSSKPQSPPNTGKNSRGRMPGSAGTAGTQGGFFGENEKTDLINEHLGLTSKFESKSISHEKLHKEQQKKNESYLRREVFYKTEISRLKQTLEQTVLCRGGGEVSMTNIRSMHEKINSNIEEMQTRTTRIVEEHERDLLRQFRSKIIEIEGKLKKEQNKSDDVAGVPKAWIERTAKLSKEVDKNKEQAIRLDRINEVLNRSIDKYRAECKAQEDEREFLVRQLVAVKKENSRLRREIEKLSVVKLPEGHSTPQPLTVRSATPASTTGGRVSQIRDAVEGSRPLTSASAPGGIIVDDKTEERRYGEVLDRLKKLLETERRHTRDARASHMRLITNRTELEGMLRESIDQVKQEAGVSTADVSTSHGLQKEDRERVLEMLLSQEKTIALLYGQQVRGGVASTATHHAGVGSTLAGDTGGGGPGLDVDRQASYADDLEDVAEEEEP